MMRNVASGWVVVPAYNEATGLPAFLTDLTRSLAPLAREESLEFTILIVDDGSSDRLIAVLEDFAQSQEAGPIALRYVSLVRNFGYQAGIVAGLVEASRTADFAVTMDADGEHPCELIPALVREWRRGSAIVHTARRPHAGLSRLKRWTSAAYYRVLRAVSGLQISSGMADFRLWDGDLLRQVADVLPNCGSTRAFASWLAPDAPVIRYDQKLVTGRISRFTQRKMWSLALSGIIRYSDLPLRLSMIVGALGLLFGAILSMFVLWAVLAGHTVAGWASTILTITIFGSFQCVALGILGEYLLRNFFRHSLPRYVVVRRSGFEAQREHRNGSRAGPRCP